MTAALPVHPYVIVRCQRCGNNTRGHREAGTEYCTSCGGVLPNTPRAATNAHVGIIKCGICGVSILANEIPYRGLVSDIPCHPACYREHYGAIEYEPEQCKQARHREP